MPALLIGLVVVGLVVVVVLAMAKRSGDIVELHPPSNNTPPGVVPPKLSRSPLGGAPPEPQQRAQTVELLRRRVEDLQRPERTNDPADDTADDSDGALAGLLRAGQKIEAIKRYRQRTGLGLKEAKDAIDALERGAPLARREAPADDERLSDSAIDELLRAGQKIEAIKLYRQRTGLGLKEAKEAIDAWPRRQ